MNTTRTLLLSALLVFAAVLPQGCAEHRTVRTVEYSGTAPRGQLSTETATVHTETEVHDVDDDGGLISGTFEIIGDVIALPFRLVGDLFRAIF